MKLKLYMFGHATIRTNASTSLSMTKAAAFFSGALLFSSHCFSQDTSKVSRPEFSGYVDAYGAYYTDSVGAGNFQKFPSVSPRSNQLGLNVAMFTVKYATDRVRSVVTLHFGDIPRSTWDAAYNYVQEANAGIRLCKKWWLDAGFFRTHFGTESLFPKENITSSVSVCTFFEPYFEAGLKLNYSPNDKLSASFFLLNGYNIYTENNNKKSIGLLLTYSFNDKLNIGYSNYTGDDSPVGDTLSHLRIHNNIFINAMPGKFKIQVGGDFCYQEHSYISDPKKSATMFAGVASLKYQCCKNAALYTRGEIFNDPQGFMGGTFIDKKGVVTGLKLWGATLGVEYKPVDNAYIRLECRSLMTDPDQEIFRWNGENEDSRMEVMLHMGVSF